MKIRNLLIAATIVGGAMAVISAHGNTPEAQARIAAREAKAEQVAKQPKLWQATKDNVRGLAFACQSKELQPALKDLSSLRVLDSGMAELTDTHVTVFVRYTATNSFGGRIQDVHTCTYTR